MNRTSGRKFKCYLNLKKKEVNGYVHCQVNTDNYWNTNTSPKQHKHEHPYKAEYFNNMKQVQMEEQNKRI